MNESLKQTLDDYYKSIKEVRPNYRACYNSFLDYCDKFSNISLKEMFEKHITLIEIQHACKEYVEKSKKATSIEAIQRFLTAIDQFYKYIEKGGIQCEPLKNGCRRKEVVHDICMSLNEELKQNIYLPFDNDCEMELVKEQIEFLNKENFYQFGQSIIYRLLALYGFKEKIIINIKLTDLNVEEGTLLIDCDEEYNIHIKLRKDILQDLVQYCTLHKYPNREYLFTKSNGVKLTPDSIFPTLKGRMKRLNVSNFTPTSVALQGVANLIEKGLSLGEIKLLTGFETQKIEDVSKYLLMDEDVEKVINDKL